MRAASSIPTLAPPRGDVELVGQRQHEMQLQQAAQLTKSQAEALFEINAPTDADDDDDESASLSRPLPTSSSPSSLGDANPLPTATMAV
jgi:hypothetical protein